MNGFCLRNRQHGLASTIRTARAGERPSVESCDPDASLSTTVSPEQNAVVHDHFDRYPTEGVAARSSAVGTLEIAEAEAWDWVTVQATRGFRASQGKHAVEMEVTPVGTGRRRPVGDTRKGNTDKTSLRCSN